MAPATVVASPANTFDVQALHYDARVGLPATPVIGPTQTYFSSATCWPTCFAASEVGQLPKPLFRQCETCGSGSEEGKASQPRIPHERRARRSEAFSRV